MIDEFRAELAAANTDCQQGTANSLHGWHHRATTRTAQLNGEPYRL